MRDGRKRQRAQALIEYAFLFVLIATITIGIILVAGEQLKETYENVIQAIESVQP
jgi:Flp pilus assembly pilin Flp